VALKLTSFIAAAGANCFHSSACTNFLRGVVSAIALSISPRRQNGNSQISIFANREFAQIIANMLQDQQYSRMFRPDGYQF